MQTTFPQGVHLPGRRKGRVPGLKTSILWKVTCPLWTYTGGTYIPGEHPGVHHPLLAISGLSSTAFCTYSLGSHDTLRHCQRARACRCGGEKSRALRQGTVFQLFVQMALWDTLGSGMDQHFAPELFAGASKTTTFYKGFTVPSRAQ